MREWMRWLGLWGRKARRFLAKASGTPHQIALGVAVGFFVGWLPIIGIQMAVALILCSILRCNPVVPLGPIWLTNPFTFIPVYGTNYVIGRCLVGGPPAKEVMLGIKNALTPPNMGADLWSNPPLWLFSWVVEFFRNARHFVRRIVELGAEMMLPLWLGSLLVGVALAVISYYLTRWTVTQFRDRLAQKLARRAAKRAEVLPPPHGA